MTAEEGNVIDINRYEDINWTRYQLSRF